MKHNLTKKRDYQNLHDREIWNEVIIQRMEKAFKQGKLKRYKRRSKMNNKSKLITEQCIATDKFNLLRDGENPVKYYFKKLYLRYKLKKAV